jgi:hypothetical protein
LFLSLLSLLLSLSPSLAVAFTAAIPPAAPFS